jgi:hypothetical protein
MPTYPNAPHIPAFQAGYAPFAADLTADITTPFSALCYSPLFRGEVQSAQSITATTNTVLQYTSLEDPYGGWSSTATGSQPANSWLAPAGWSGWYEITINNRINGNATTQIIECMLFGGTGAGAGTLEQEMAGNASPANASIPGGASGPAWVYLTGGQDFVQGAIWTGLAATANTTVGQRCDIEVAWVSA